MERTCPDRSALLLFVEGELGAGEADKIAAHVGTCPVCGGAVSEMRTLTDELRRAGGTNVLSGSRHDESGRTADCPEPVRIAAYVDGSLDAGTAALVERHVVSCRTCLAEVADLWHMMGPENHDASEGAVAAALALLETDARTAVLRWAEQSLELVRGFASSLATVAGAADAELVPAAATSRSAGGEARLLWSGEAGAELVGAVRSEGDTVSLTGRVTVRGAPAIATSAGLSSAEAVRGPESLDADGRFGPWPLSPGRNLLRLTGLPGRSGSAELVVMVIGAQEDEEPH
jgi:anti-sigma factor ChrR (cupin superfamily)